MDGIHEENTGRKAEGTFAVARNFQMRNWKISRHLSPTRTPDRVAGVFQDAQPIGCRTGADRRSMASLRFWTDDVQFQSG